jgi:hypothetical protein
MPQFIPVETPVTVAFDLQYPSSVYADETFILALTPTISSLPEIPDGEPSRERDRFRIAHLKTIHDRLEKLTLHASLRIAGVDSTPQEPADATPKHTTRWSLRAKEPGRYHGFIRVTTDGGYSKFFHSDDPIELSLPEFSDIVFTSKPRLFTLPTLIQATVGFFGSYLTLAGLIELTRRLLAARKKQPSPIIIQ